MPIYCDAWPLNPKLRLLAASCLLSLGCSDGSYRLGGVSEASSSGEARPGTLCANGADFEVLDEMEDDDGAIEMLSGRGGVWFAFNDETEGTQLPASNEETFVMTELSPPRAGSRFAARTQGGGFTEWGAGIGFELRNQKAYDIARYAGVSFWARREPDSASTLRFAVTDAATTPRGGQCQEYVDYSTCSDHFGVNVTLDTTFQRYRFTWEELTQVGWGEPHAQALDTAHVYGVRFQMSKNEDFDFWIDDIALLCRPE